VTSVSVRDAVCDGCVLGFGNVETVGVIGGCACIECDFLAKLGLVLDSVLILNIPSYVKTIR
jgi:hypothetical protein